MDVSKSVDLLKEKLSEWLEQLILILPNAIVAFFILVISFFVARYLRRIMKNILDRYLQNHALVRFLSGLTQIAVFFLGFIIAINIMQLDEAVVSLLAGVGIVGLAVGFAFQDVASNFIAGVALVLRKDYPFKVGDIVETNDYVGNVKEINLRATMLETFEGQEVLIPNRLIFEKAVINFSILGRRRVDIPVGISYGDDLERVKKAVEEAIKQVKGLISDSGIEIFFNEFGNSSINFTVRFWVPFVKETDYLKARDEAIMLIKKSFDENDITIPFPIRTLDFGIKGGRTLKEMLPEKE